VSGKALPTEEELQGSSGLSPASAAGSKGLPYFWCTVLCNQDTLAESITPRDRQALHYLTHITAASSPSSSSGGATTVELHFGTNPYFTNKVLRRGISVDEATGELQEVSTDIVWKEGKELTLKVRGSAAGAGLAAVHRRVCRCALGVA
jgi:nucleosome assembly protein 1-like 1